MVQNANHGKKELYTDVIAFCLQNYNLCTDGQAQGPRTLAYDS